ncbi:hypothetical protein E2C01_053227 [Portunus trituberculatus]|uniref:Uncharacterized protein n=1 Tax=Portunus trituberculatus TaxID=210409 RepID=A0A5B7GGI5_PORTR|nr:hypothetical protein [Portunus trituberculatus]
MLGGGQVKDGDMGASVRQKSMLHETAAQGKSVGKRSNSSSNSSLCYLAGRSRMNNDSSCGLRRLSGKSE